MFDDIIAALLDKLIGDSARGKSFVRWFLIILVAVLVLHFIVLYFLNN